MFLLIILAVLLVAVIGVTYVTYRIAFYVPRGYKEDIFDIPDEEQYRPGRDFMVSIIKEMEAIPCEWVTITADDGTKLWGRYYHVRDGAPLQLQFHGYRGSALRDFCGGNKLVRELGHNSLVVDQRAHGRSGGRTITFGVKERRDCLRWVEYACRRFGEETPVFLSGVSMGAATVLMAAELELPGNIRGIVADSPYSSPEAIIRKVCRDRGFPPRLVFPFLMLGAWMFGGFDLRSASAVEAVRHARVPILLIHGEDDRFVPCDMSREIYDACVSEKQRVTFPDAGHGISYIVDTARYNAAVTAFLEAHE